MAYALCYAYCRNAFDQISRTTGKSYLNIILLLYIYTLHKYKTHTTLPHGQPNRDSRDFREKSRKNENVELISEWQIPIYQIIIVKYQYLGESSYHLPHLRVLFQLFKVDINPKYSSLDPKINSYPRNAMFEVTK